MEFRDLLASLCGGCSPVKTRLPSATAQVNHHAPTATACVVFITLDREWPTEAITLCQVCTIERLLL